MKNRFIATCLLAAILPFLWVVGCSSNKSAPATAEKSEPAPAPAPAPAPPENPPVAQTPPDNAVPSRTESAPRPATSAPAGPAKSEVTTPAAVKPVVIPAGTVVTVRLEDSISSKTSHEGDRFQASVAEPVMVHGQTLVPKGASASGIVTEAKSAGRFKGAASLSLALDKLVIRGTPYRITTTAFEETSKGKGKRTAAMVGGGAAGGALIGGLAGGGKGAAIGILAGGGAGTAGAGLTGNNRDISLPSEAAVKFQLASALTLRPPAEAHSMQ